MCYFLICSGQLPGWEAVVCAARWPEPTCKGGNYGGIYHFCSNNRGREITRNFALMTTFSAEWQEKRGIDKTRNTDTKRMMETMEMERWRKYQRRQVNTNRNSLNITEALGYQRKFPSCVSTRNYATSTLSARPEFGRDKSSVPRWCQFWGHFARQPVWSRLTLDVGHFFFFLQLHTVQATWAPTLQDCQIYFYCWHKKVCSADWKVNRR